MSRSKFASFPAFQALVAMLGAVWLETLVVAACSALALGCAGMIAGTHDWFERKRPDVEPMASSDLACPGPRIEFVAPVMNDYREVEAHGCGKKARYKFVKVGPVGNWTKSSAVSSM